MNEVAKGVAETTLEYITEHMSEIVVRIDRAGLILYVSPSIQSYGYQPDELVGTPLMALFPPEEHARCIEIAGAMLASNAEPAKAIEQRLRRADGSWAWIEGSPHIVRDADGNLIEFVNVLRDVTERHVAAEALRAHEARFQLIAETMSDLIVQADTEGIVTYVSPAIRRYGYEAQELIGLPSDALVHPDDKDRARAYLQQATPGQVADNLGNTDVRCRTASGGWVWLESSIQTMRDDAGQVIGSLNVLRDVTARHAQLQLFETAFRHAPVGIALVSLRGEFLRVNDAFCGMVGYSEAALLQTDTPGISHPDDRVAGHDERRRLLRGEIAKFQQNKRYLKPDGTVVWARLTVALARNTDGSPDHFITQFEDLTARLVAEEALKTSEALFRLIGENTSDIIAMHDLTGRITYLSPAIRQAGYEPDELLGQVSTAYMPPEDAKSVADAFGRLLAGDDAGPVRVRWRGRHGKTGDLMWLESSPSLVRDPSSGKPTGFLDTVRDITQQVRQEEALSAARAEGEAMLAALHESETRYRLIAENSSDLITMTSADGRHTYISPSIRYLGYEPDEARELGLAQLLHPDDLATVRASFRRHQAGAESPRLRLRMRHGKTGDWRWMESAPAQVKDPVSGEFTGVLDVARDVTVQVEHEAAVAKARDEADVAAAALNESEARYRMIAENTSDLIAISNREGRLSYLSPSIRRLGYEPEALVGGTTGHLVHRDDRQVIWDNLQAQLAGAPVQRLRWRFKHGKSGDWVWLESEPTRLLDPVTHEAMGFLDVIRDVSMQVRQEEIVAQARAEAEAAAVAKSQFLANMSHEIRTPLTAVLGFTRLLQQEARLDSRAEGYVSRIAGAGSALLALVNDILDFSKIEVGKITLRPQPTDVGALARESLALFAAQASEKAITVELETAGGLASSVMIDSDRLRQVLINLIGNAVKFTQTGGVILRIAPIEDGRSLRFEVEDTGPGLHADQCVQLFQRFNQIDGSTMRQHGGTGLGLAISRGLVEAMGGEIGLSSVPDQGSIFYFELPAEAVMAEEFVEEAEVVSIEGLRVMVIDDNQINRELARLILEALGAEVAEAESGPSGLAQLARLAVDVVLMDVRMPGMDGHQALSTLRGQPGPNRNIPVLAFTADAEMGESAPLDAFDGVVRKPIEVVALSGLIAAVAGRDRDVGAKVASC